MNPAVKNELNTWSEDLVAPSILHPSADESEPAIKPDTPTFDPDTDAPGHFQPSPGPTTDPFRNPDPDGDDEPCHGPCKF